MATVLSWHVQNLVARWYLTMELQQNQFPLKLRLQGKIICEMSHWAVFLYLQWSFLNAISIPGIFLVMIRQLSKFHDKHLGSDTICHYSNEILTFTQQYSLGEYHSVELYSTSWFHVSVGLYGEPPVPHNNAVMDFFISYLTLKGPIPYIYGTQVWLSLCLQMS